MDFTARLGTHLCQPGNITLAYSPIFASAASEIALGHCAESRMDFFNAFDKVIPLLGLSQDSQGSQALIHALLQCGGFYSPRDEKHANPFQEVIHRLEQWKVNPHALTILRQFFNAATERYDRS